jgi:cell division protein FtsQ
VKKVVKILTFIIPVIYIPVLLVLASAEYNKLACKNIQVVVVDSAMNRFVNGNDVLAFLKRNNFKLTGANMNDINAQDIEDFIDKLPSVKKSECYKTINGTFKIEITQRRPVLRVISKGVQFYIDSEGEVMPVSRNYTAWVPVAVGQISKDFAKKHLFVFAEFLNDNDFWRAQVSQIYVRNSGEIEIIPRVGNHIIELGKIENLESKFNRLEALYVEKFNTEGWNKYKKISVKFDNQVVCTKK